MTDTETEVYQIPHRPRWNSLENGYSIDGYTAWEFTSALEGEEAFKDLLTAVLGGLARYKFGTWDELSYDVFDTQERCLFQIGIESEQIVVFAKESTTPASVEAFHHRLETISGEEWEVDRHSTGVSVDAI